MKYSNGDVVTIGDKVACYENGFIGQVIEVVESQELMSEYCFDTPHIVITKHFPAHKRSHTLEVAEDSIEENGIYPLDTEEFSKFDHYINHAKKQSDYTEPIFILNEYWDHTISDYRWVIAYDTGDDFNLIKNQPAT